MSEWGHDFRPDYRRLKDAADACRRSDGRAGRPPMAAFTATATPEVRDDIVLLLGLADPRVVVAGFDRPNISLAVRPVSGDIEKHELLPELVGTGRALVYASTRKKAEAAAETLKAAGIDAAAYHAGLADGGAFQRPGAIQLRARFASSARPTRLEWASIDRTLKRLPFGSSSCSCSGSAAARNPRRSRRRGRAPGPSARRRHGRSRPR